MPIMVSKNSYENCLKTMYGFRRFGIKLGLSTIKKILAGLDDPQDTFACIHVAGTNGKGSVASSLASISRISTSRKLLHAVCSAGRQCTCVLLSTKMNRLFSAWTAGCALSALSCSMKRFPPFMVWRNKKTGWWHPVFEWYHLDSNQGHKDFQSFALPTELWHQTIFGSANVE